MELGDTQCIACGGGELRLRGGEIRCSACDVVYDVYNGVPCLARYQQDEVLSLVEVLAHAGTERSAPARNAFADWPRLLQEYHQSEDREAYRSRAHPSHAAHLPHRYIQYAVMREMLDGVPMEGKKLLNVGAGEGFDSAIFQDMGADVTSLEFSPLLAAHGANATPGVRWFAGSGHALPFKSESFDLVVCQATLHHMLHIPTCLTEMLRVLRPGGLLATISDSFRADRYGEIYVCKRFNDDPAVLSGINENIPPFSEICRTFLEFDRDLDVSFLTTIVYGMPNEEKTGRSDVKGHHWWTMKDVERLADSSGGVSCLVRKKAPLSISSTKLASEVIRPNELLGDVKDKDLAMANLAQYLPVDYASTAFPGEPGNTRFQMLNGWRIRTDAEVGRTAYNRARWFLTRGDAHKSIRLRLSAVDDGATNVTILVAGREEKTLSLSEEPQEFEFQIDGVRVAEPFAVEVRCPQKPKSFKEGLMRVESIHLQP